MDRDALFDALARSATDALPGLDQRIVVRALAERENKGTTATRDGVAFPHAIVDDSPQLLVIPAVVSGGVRFTATAAPAQLIFFTVGSRRDPTQHIRVLARLSRLALQPAVRDRLLGATDGAQLVDLVLAEDRAHG